VQDITGYSINAGHDLSQAAAACAIRHPL